MLHTCIPDSRAAGPKNKLVAVAMQIENQKGMGGGGGGGGRGGRQCRLRTRRGNRLWRP